MRRAVYVGAIFLTTMTWVIDHQLLFWAKSGAFSLWFLDPLSATRFFHSVLAPLIWTLIAEYPQRLL